MDFRVGILIPSLLLGTVQPDPSSQACTSFTDLSEPCGCTVSAETFNPICGSDGQTYLSLCFLECRKAIDTVDINIESIGVCTIIESQCTCHAGYTPVCGTNGVTYSNECVFNCFMKKDNTIRLKHDGECGSAVEQLLNDDKYEPGICRCRSKLRSNYTRLDVNGQRLARSQCGGCRKKKKKLQAELPVYSSTQNNRIKSRPNEEMLLKLAMIDSKKCVCAAVHRPVCGNNQRTYANFCVLYCSSKKDPGAKLLHWGDCSNTQLITNNK